MIVFGMRDIGGANAILTVAKRWYGNPAILYADGVSYERFRNDYPLVSSLCSPSKIIDWFRPRVVLVTTCSPGGVVPLELLEVSKEKGIPVVAIQDFWGNHRKHTWKIFPDAICVQDEFAKKLVFESWLEQGFTESKIFVTGQPAFDRLKDVDTVTAQQELKKNL